MTLWHMSSVTKGTTNRSRSYSTTNCPVWWLTLVLFSFFFFPALLGELRGHVLLFSFTLSIGWLVIPVYFFLLISLKISMYKHFLPPPPLLHFPSLFLLFLELILYHLMDDVASLHFFKCTYWTSITLFISCLMNFTYNLCPLI